METEPKIIADYVRPGKVRLVYRHLAQISDLSVRTGEASECAADQSKFWEMRELLYSKQNDIFGGDPNTAILELAGGLGMNKTDFAGCLSSGKHRQFVLDDYKAAQSEGVRSRPEFRLGDQRLVGALPYAKFQQGIDALLAGK